VAIAVVLFPISDEAPALQPAALEKLVQLGVTNVSLLRDRTTVGLVLEGWAFDPKRARDAARAVAGASEGVRTLRPLMQMAVASASTEGGVT
jgi:hypothetical protein